MAFPVFGPGSVYLTRTDVTNATPVNIGFAQEFSIDEAIENKQLFGQNRYALVSAVGTVKLTGKVKAAMISGYALNSAIHGGTLVNGQLLASQGESATVPTSSPFTYTSANAARFDADLGVTYSTTGLPVAKVSSLTGAGQYAVNATTGVYTFSSSDSGVAMKLNYAFTSTTSGQTLTIQNGLIGQNPVFQLDYVTVLNGKSYYARLFQCVATKLTQHFKLTDFMMPEIDFEAHQNTAGQVIEFSFPETAP